MADSYSLDDLLYLMQRLRDPVDGCPWDREQDFDSIIQHSIEEVYELADAIATRDFTQLRDELGDVLFQVIFFSQLGREEGRFDFSDVVDNLVKKLLRRHPHVFPDGRLESRAGSHNVHTDQVKASWESIKQNEREEKKQRGILADVPLALPGLTRAAKLQKRAANVGFDWSDINEVFDKLIEELDELKYAIGTQKSADIEEELGDLLFCCANLGRKLRIDCEAALRTSNRKFECRFAYIEDKLNRLGITPADATLEQMDQLWDEIRARDKLPDSK